MFIMNQTWDGGWTEKRKYIQQANHLSHSVMPTLVLLTKVQTFGNAQSSPSSSSAPFLPVPHWLSHTPWTGKKSKQIWTGFLRRSDQSYHQGVQTYSAKVASFEAVVLHLAAADHPNKLGHFSSDLFVQLIIFTFKWRRKKNGNICLQMTKNSCSLPKLASRKAVHCVQLASCICLGLQNEVQHVHFWAVHYCVCRVAIHLFHRVLPSLFSPICKFGILFLVQQ